MPGFHHVVLTRFNSPVTADDRALTDDWLAPRFALFEEVCCPSVARQTCRDFTWLVFFDARTPDRWQSKARELAEVWGYQPVWLAEPFSGAVAARAIESLGLDERTHLMSTRLDNDDAIAPHYVATVQQRFAGQELEYLNLPFGYQLADGQIYFRPYIANPFITLIEARQEGSAFRTVYETGHHEIMSRPVKQVLTKPAWLQMIHGGNLNNDVRGIRVAGRGAAKAFDLPPDAVRPGGGLARTAGSVRDVARFVGASLQDPTTRARFARLVRRRPRPPG